MPGQNKKWDDKAERDLCLAIILGKHDSQRYDWPAIHKIMTDIGHGFTKDAISYAFSRSLICTLDAYIMQSAFHKVNHERVQEPPW